MATLVAFNATKVAMVALWDAEQRSGRSGEAAKRG
jgi:hypothetical protein